jgi:bifunctional DNA-binding transcriptional regulator/antitoxin component of YhaV-PrlF toxin-antitoxin module
MGLKPARKLGGGSVRVWAILGHMGPTTITVHESVPVTVPAELLRHLEAKTGDQLEWRVERRELVVRRFRSVDSLRECLASKGTFPGLEAEKAANPTRPGQPPQIFGQPVSPGTSFQLSTHPGEKVLCFEG